MAQVSRKEILQEFRTRSLLAATRALIADQGFDAVTMERVAEQAGITKGAIYLYFRNKDQMIMEALEEIAAEMLQEIESGVNASAPPWERLCQTVRAQLTTLENHKDMLRTLLLFRWLLGNQGQRKKWQSLLRYREMHLQKLKGILNDGTKLRLFQRMDSGAAAFYINEMIIGTALRRMMGLSQVPLESEVHALVGFLSLFRRRRNDAREFEERE